MKARVQDILKLSKTKALCIAALKHPKFSASRSRQPLSCSSLSLIRNDKSEHFLSIALYWYQKA